jgi:hypothetical protein
VTPIIKSLSSYRRLDADGRRHGFPEAQSAVALLLRPHSHESSSNAAANTEPNAGANMNTQTVEQISESALRRKAHRRRLSLVKYRENSRWFYQYGPYALVDDRNTIAFHSLDLAEASELLDSVSV